MGLFSSKKKHTVGTSVSRVIADERIPNAVASGVIASIVQDQSDQLVEHVLENLTTCIGTKAERMYEYGGKGYLFGRPKSTILDSTGWFDTLYLYLSSLHSETVVVDYNKYGSLNVQHQVWQALVDQYGYDPTTNTLATLSAQKGTLVYLENFEIAITDEFARTANALSLEQWGKSPKDGPCPSRAKTRLTRKQTPFHIDQGATTNYAQVTVCWCSSGIKREVLTLTLPDTDPDLGYFQSIYSVVRRETSYDFFLNKNVTTTTVRSSHVFTYLEGSGSIDVLDAVFSTEHDDFGSFFPIGYFRYNKKDCLGNKTEDEYKHSKKLMKYLNLDFDMMAEAIKENPDIGDVESALLMLAVPADSEDLLELRYLFDFFNGMYLKTGGTAVTKSVADDMFYGVTKETSALSVVIQDKRFKMSVSMDGLNRITQHGRIGNKGTYAHVYNEKARTITISATDNQGSPYKRYVAVSCHYYRYQITETQYQEVQVYGLIVAYHVWGKYVATVRDDGDNLLIPLDHSLTEHYLIPDREYLYSRALHYVFNSHVVTKVKWYQSGFFEFLMIVIAVVITVFSIGSGGGALAAVLSATTVSAALAILGPLVLEAILTMVVVKLFVKLVGPKLAFLAAIVGACYGMYSYFSTGSLQGMPFAEDLMIVSTSIGSEVGNTYAGMTQDILQEMKDLADYSKSAFDALEDVNKSLLADSSSALSPFVLFGESPDDYYLRTVHADNVGTYSFDMVTNFADMALTLPDFGSTMSTSFGSPT